MASPLAQFEIKEIIPIVVSNYNISLTNSSLAMIFTAMIILLFLFFGLRNLNIIPNKFQVAVELSYEFIAGMIKELREKSTHHKQCSSWPWRCGRGLLTPANLEPLRPFRQVKSWRCTTSRTFPFLTW